MKRNWNLTLWVGFVLVLVGIFSYPLFFARFPITRDFPWANLALIALALFLLGVGMRRAFRQPDSYRGKISGSILSVLTVLLVGFFLVEIFHETKEISPSQGAPKVGEIAPDFTLPDSQGNPVTLSAMLNSSFVPNGSSSAAAASSSAKTAGTVLIFYRGYW
jgi:lysylphosphatidylglycerol synthetase-like protein (DUF2156 family)